MNPATLQLINTIVGALIIAAIVALARWITGKADKVAVDKRDSEHKAEYARLHTEAKDALTKIEVKLDAALLIVGAAITRPELAEKILAMTGRADDQKLRMQADIVQLFTKAEANAKAIVEQEKKMDDMPGRLRQVEENQKRN